MWLCFVQVKYVFKYEFKGTLLKKTESEVKEAELKSKNLWQPSFNDTQSRFNSINAIESNVFIHIQTTFSERRTYRIFCK